ncbi:MAG TPA: hypothetical protein VF007_02620, partial [Stellaceae bacterium]
ARLAGFAEFWLDKPVIAINTATCRSALRSNGIADKGRGIRLAFAASVSRLRRGRAGRPVAY